MPSQSKTWRQFGRFMESLYDIESRVETMNQAIQNFVPIGTKFCMESRGWFMGSLHDFRIALWDHEPGSAGVSPACRIRAKQARRRDASAPRKGSGKESTNPDSQIVPLILPAVSPCKSGRRQEVHGNSLRCAICPLRARISECPRFRLSKPAALLVSCLSERLCRVFTSKPMAAR
jgi:hypothetical protein